MSLSNKELLDIKNKLADEHGWLNWDAIPASTFKDELWDIVCERFATEKAKELLPKEKKEPTPTKYSNDPVLIKYEYPEQVSPVESQEELMKELIKAVKDRESAIYWSDFYENEADFINSQLKKFSITRLTP